MSTKNRTTVYFTDEQAEYMKKAAEKLSTTRNQFLSDLINKEMKKKVKK